MRAVHWVWLGVLSTLTACAIHSDGDPDAGGAGGVGATGGTGGTGATGGSAGDAGMGATGGSGGVGATGGTGGMGATGGSAGDAGIGATGGSGGVGATGGSAGDAGTGGSAGDAGTGGSGGDAGTGGTGAVCAIDRTVNASSVRNVGKVYYGTLSPTQVDLTSGQMLAIGKIDLEDNTSVALCSGTLVTPRWVLTAKHCTEGFVAANVTFSIGHMPGAPNHAFDVDTIVEHPSADVALLYLDEVVTNRVPEMAPIRLFTGSLDSSWLGRVVEAAGYGQKEDLTTGTRYFTAEPIDSFVSDEVWIDGQGQRGVCGGDSGGPLLAEASDGSIRVIGELHGGDSSCVGVDHYTRVDLYRTWIEQSVGTTPTTEDLPCGTLNTAGRCFGDTAVYCAGNVIQRDTCTGSTSCGWNGTAQGFRCIAGIDPCGGYDSYGGCDGDTAHACVDGALQTVDCDACGLVCRVDETNGANCVEAPVDPCDGLDFLGRCNGEVAEWCDNGEFKTRDCASFGQTCAWRGSSTGYYCGS